MSTIKNSQISLYYHFNKIIKVPETSFQSPTLSQKHVKNMSKTFLSYNTLVFDQISFRQNLGFKRNKLKCNFHYVAMLMVASQILKSVDFTKAQKSRYLKNEILFLFQIKKIINCASRATLWQKNNFVAEVTLKSLRL